MSRHVIQNRIQKNYKHRQKWARRQNIDAYRLYERDIPEFPFIVDKYQNYLLIYERKNEKLDQGKEDHLQHLLDALEEVTGFQKENMILKSRVRQSGEQQYTKLKDNKEFLVVREHQGQFFVNLDDYLDTGLFLDHRPMRQRIFKESKNKRVLNLFCYTGSVSVFAALGGAEKVVSVDMSATYIDWAKKNFQLNQINLKPHEFYCENALRFLQEHEEQYDLIFLDPPTFSNSKKMRESFEVEKDQDMLIRNCLRMLAPGGDFYFSNNKRKFRLSDSIQESCLVKDISKSTIPEDFRDQKIHHCFKMNHK